MSNHVESDVSVQRFAFDDDANGLRLTFPQANLGRVEGRSGPVTYGVGEAVLTNLVGRLQGVNWTAGSATFGAGWLRDDNGQFDISIHGITHSEGILLTSAASGVEITSPSVTMEKVKLSIRGPFAPPEAEPPPPQDLQKTGPPAPPTELRQEQLRFLDSLAGKINITVKVVLDLPVLGKRTLDQQLRVPIVDGNVDFHALEESLDWLEGRFIDIDFERNKLALQWKVPIFGSGRDLVTWKLDEDAAKLAAFGKVPVRSLTDVRLPPSKHPAKQDKRQLLRSLSLEAIDIALSLIAPRSVDVGGGVILFGGDDAPGMVDMKVTGSINDRGPGKLVGKIGSIDTTIKDLQLGPVLLTADRLQLDGVDDLVVVFQGFVPSRIDLVINKVTALNLAVRLGGD